MASTKYLDKDLRYKRGFLRSPQGKAFLRIVLEDWYKFLIFPGLHLHTLLDSHSNHSNRTSYHQLCAECGPYDKVIITVTNKT